MGKNVEEHIDMEELGRILAEEVMNLPEPFSELTAALNLREVTT